MEPRDERTRYRSVAAVPYLAELQEDFRAWVPQTVELRGIDKRLVELKATETEIAAVHPTREEALAQLRESYERYEERQTLRLVKFLSEQFGKNSSDVLSRGERLDFLTRAVIGLDQWEKAFELVPDEVFSEVPNLQRAAALGDLQKERAKLKKRAAELRCPPYLKLRNGEVVDIREVFIDAWMGKQREVRGPCDAQGFDLREADEDVRWAYAELGIAGAIGGKLALLPATKV